MNTQVAESKNNNSWYAGLTPKHWKILKSSFIGWMFDGFEAVALIVVLFPMLKSVLTPAQMATPSVYAGLVIGMTLLGWGIGGIVGGVLADYFGRKRVMLWSVFLYALFSGLTAFSNSIATLCVMRFLTGLAMGSEWSTGIALLAETWPEKARAKGAGFLQSGFGFGTLLAALVWYGLSTYNPMGADTWRLMFVLGALPAFFVLYIRRSIGESEQWMQALANKRWSATGNSSAPSSDSRPFTLKQLFQEPEARRLTLLTFLLSLMTTTAWWAISSWLPTFTVAIAKAEGLADAATWGSKITIYYTIGGIVAYWASGFIIDWIGRRWFLFFTFLGALIATYITYKMTTTMFGMMIIAPINGFFTLGCGFVWMAIYLAELFAPTVRSTALSVVNNGARMVAWIFPIMAGSMIESFGGVAQAALTMSSVYVIGLVIPWFLPETKGKGLPQ